MKDDIRKAVKGLRGRVGSAPAKAVGGMIVTTAEGKRMFKAKARKKAVFQSIHQAEKNYFIQGSVHNQVIFQSEKLSPEQRWTEGHDAVLNLESVPFFGYESTVRRLIGPEVPITHLRPKDVLVVAGGVVINTRPPQTNYVLASDIHGKKTRRNASHSKEPSVEEVHQRMNAFAQQLRNDPKLSHDFFYDAGLVTETGEWKEHYRK